MTDNGALWDNNLSIFLWEFSKFPFNYLFTHAYFYFRKMTKNILRMYEWCGRIPSTIYISDK